MPDAPDPITWRPRDEFSLGVELATPQFGGGAVARKVDLDQWLRPSAVRGALRFWWRALHAHECRTAGELFERESIIFGRAADAGRSRDAVQITVHCDRPNASAVQEWRPDQGDERNLAWFPASMDRNDPASLLAAGATAHIRVAWPKRAGELGASGGNPAAELQRAFACWLILGGNGARTRRGSGSLVPQSAAAAEAAGIPASLSSLKSWCRSLPRGPGDLGFFSLATRVGVFALPGVSGSADSAFAGLLRWLREFRQDRNHPQLWRGARNWGRTRWPEADAMRLLQPPTYARWPDGHHHAPVAGNSGKAPRAHLGLPLTIRFMDAPEGRQRADRGNRLAHDPPETEILPALGSRYPSPVVLSVARVFGQPAGFVGLVLVTRSHLGGTVRAIRRPNAEHSLSVGPWTEMQQRLVSSLRSNRFEQWDGPA